MEPGEPFYITTAIDYVNGHPHLGHAYEKVTADVIARHRRLVGMDVRFVTGTDEHGIKVQRSAQAQGVDEQTYVDGLAAEFLAAWEKLDLSHDDFIRTTEARHREVVQRLWERIHAGGDLYEASYEGWYCSGCEAFKTDKELVALDGAAEARACPIHKRDCEWISETNLFFRLSAYEQALKDHFAAHPGFLQPTSRRNEVLAMLDSGLSDISMSRESVTWGVPITFRPGSTVYVWLDALINYVSALGLEGPLFDRYWPAALHVIGKDITRFHCIFWPAMLMSAGLPLPKVVFAHGWILSGGEKLSKSLGNVVDPLDLVDQLGPDPLRWYITSEVRYGGDGEFTAARFEETYNAHLANDIGNLFSRVLNMAARYRGQVPPARPGKEPAIEAAIGAALAEYAEAMEHFALHDACAAIRRLTATLNEQVQAREPFRMAKDESRAEELDGVLHALLAGVRTAAILLQPVMPGSAAKMLAALGAGREPVQIPADAAAAIGGLEIGTALKKPEPLFPRLG